MSVVDDNTDGLEQLILVDALDREIGQAEKLIAHQKGLLHRAFSVFLFDKLGRMIVQQRAAGKYHSAGLWSNACCSHPRPGESTADAAVRRTFEELGVKVSLTRQFHFTYRTSFANGLVENELDHVYFGQSDLPTTPVASEVAAVRAVDLAELEREVLADPEQFTVWFRLCLPRVLTLRTEALRA